MDVLDPKVNEAIRLISTGRGKEAIPVLEEAVAADGSSFERQNYLAMAYAQSLQFPQAIQAFQKAIALRPTDAPTFFNLGVAYQRTGQVETAKQAFSRAVVLDPAYTKAATALERLQKQFVVAPPQAPAAAVPPSAEPTVASEHTVSSVRPPSSTSRSPRSAVAKSPVRSSRKFLLPGVSAAVVAVAAVYFLFFASTPKKVAEAYIAARKEFDYKKLEQLCTRDSQKQIEMEKKMMASMPKQFRTSQADQMTPRELGEVKVEGDTARVAAKMIMKIPTSFSFTAGQMPQMKETVIKAPLVLLKEDHKWKVDIAKTQQEFGQAYMETPEGKAMMQQLQNRMSQQVGSSFPGSGGR